MNKKTFRNTIAFAVPALIILTALTIILSINRKDDIEGVNNRTVLKYSGPWYRSYPIMGTWAEISIYGNRKAANKAMDTIHDAFNEVNQICSRFNPKSELSCLNATAADKPFKCSPLLWDVLVKSKYYYDLSNGSFDVTITPLMKLWGFYQKQNKIPSDQEIKKALTLVGFDKVIFNSKNRTVFFQKAGMQIDLGGIAKGYAVDYAYESIKKHNSYACRKKRHAQVKLNTLKPSSCSKLNQAGSIKSGVINLGGNIRFFPTPPPGKKYYSAGIRNPFNKTKLMNGTLKLLNSSLATSGDYEKFTILNDQRFTHIINPQTGYPVKDMAAVTIVAHFALTCDALSTAVFINGVNFANKIHKEFPNIDILIVKGYHDNPKSINTFKIGKIWKNIALNF
jgi:FAD:protein FMN transferase